MKIDATKKMLSEELQQSNAKNNVMHDVNVDTDGKKKMGESTEIPKKKKVEKRKTISKMNEKRKRKSHSTVLNLKVIPLLWLCSVLYVV